MASTNPTSTTVGTPGALTGRGTLGRPRGLAFAVVMSVVTLGIYTLYWAYKTYEEMRDYTGVGVGGIFGAVIQFFLAPINFFLVPYEVREMHEGDGQTSPVRGLTGFWVLLPIVGWIVWLVKVQGALNRFWEGKGATRA